MAWAAGRQSRGTDRNGQPLFQTIYLLLAIACNLKNPCSVRFAMPGALNVVSLLLVVRPGAPFVASLLLYVLEGLFRQQAVLFRTKAVPFGEKVPFLEDQSLCVCAYFFTGLGWRWGGTFWWAHGFANAEIPHSQPLSVVAMLSQTFRAGIYNHSGVDRI